LDPPGTAPIESSTGTIASYPLCNLLLVRRREKIRDEFKDKIFKTNLLMTVLDKNHTGMNQPHWYPPPRIPFKFIHRFIPCSVLMTDDVTTGTDDCH
jgi:hypothetical protein